MIFNYNRFRLKVFMGGGDGGGGDGIGGMEGAGGAGNIGGIGTGIGSSGPSIGTGPVGSMSPAEALDALSFSTSSAEDPGQSGISLGGAPTGAGLAGSNIGGFSSDPGAEMDAALSAVSNAQSLEAQQQAAKNSFVTKAKSTLAKGLTVVADLLVTTISPITAAAQGLSVATSGKGLVGNLANMAADMMANDPGMTAGEAMGAAMDANGLSGTDPAIRESIIKIADNTVGETGQQISQLANSVQNSYQLSDREIALLDQIQQNQIEIFTNTIKERASLTMKSEIARLVDRGILQGSVGANIMSRLNEDVIKAIAQGTTEIGTQRAQAELSLLETGKELDWKANQDALDRITAMNIEEMQSDAAEKASKWNLFGNVATGIIQGGFSSNDDEDKWGWSNLF